jgi:hypothetical protein
MPIMFLLGAAAAATAARDLPSMDFFCAAPVSSHSQLRIHYGGNFYRVRGLIEPVQLESVPDTSKPLQVVGNDIPHTSRGADVEISDDESNASVTLRLVPRNRQAGDGSIISDILIQTWIDGDDRSYDLFTQAHHDLRDAVPFEILASGNKVSVQAGSKRLELTVPFGPKTVVELRCIGGDFDFENVEISERRQPR